MTRFDEQPGVGHDAAKLVAAVVIMVGGTWLSGAMGIAYGSRLIAGAIGLVTAAALYLAMRRGEGAGESEEPKSKISRLGDRILVVAAIGYVVVQLIRQFSNGVSYQGAMLIGFLLGILATAAFAHWRGNFMKRQPSS